MSTEESDLIDWYGVDGEDHINVFSRGDTELGRMLSPFARIGLEHPDYGFFESLEGFYVYAATGFQHDSLRHAWGRRAKALGKELERVYCEDFEAILKKTIEYKVCQNPELCNRFHQCTLPLKHYYVFGDKRVPAKGAQWLIDGFRIVHAKLSNGELRCHRTQSKQ